MTENGEKDNEMAKRNNFHYKITYYIINNFLNY